MSHHIHNRNCKKSARPCLFTETHNSCLRTIARRVNQKGFQTGSQSIELAAALQVCLLQVMPSTYEWMQRIIKAHCLTASWTVKDLFHHSCYSLHSSFDIQDSPNGYLRVQTIRNHIFPWLRAVLCFENCPEDFWLYIFIT